MDERATRLYRARQTVMQMLCDRDYLILTADLDMTKDQFVENFSEEPRREQLTIFAPKKNDPADKIFVFFPEEAKVGVKTIKQYAEQMTRESVMSAILVVQQGLTPFARTCLAEFNATKRSSDEDGGGSLKQFRLEVFEENELLFNLTKHYLVPKHYLLTPEEEQHLLHRYKVKKEQLPRMQVTDPVARYYGMHRGNICKIIRASETAGRYITYRYVV
eukprot:jgi/Mesvir1/19115/Mv12858-RA.1